MKSGNLNFLEPSGSVQACNGTDLPILLTPWSTVHLEKLTGLQLVKKFPAFYGTRGFITALTSVRHPSLFWASRIQSLYPHPTSWRSIFNIILWYHYRICGPSLTETSFWSAYLHLVEFTDVTTRVNLLWSICNLTPLCVPIINTR